MMFSAVIKLFTVSDSVHIASVVVPAVACVAFHSVERAIANVVSICYSVNDRALGCRRTFS